MMGIVAWGILTWEEQVVISHLVVHPLNENILADQFKHPEQVHLF